MINRPETSALTKEEGRKVTNRDAEVDNINII